MSRRKKTTHPTSQIPSENREAEEDWGLAEQNAYERMLEGSYQSVPVEEFLDWLAELEQNNYQLSIINYPVVNS